MSVLMGSPGFRQLWPLALVLASSGVMASGACRDCAQPGFGGPFENRFTAYDPICMGSGCRTSSLPQAYVNLSNLTLFVRVTDLAFGGSAPAFAVERVFNMDDSRSGPFGP